MSTNKLADLTDPEVKLLAMSWLRSHLPKTQNKNITIENKYQCADITADKYAFNHYLRGRRCWILLLRISDTQYVNACVSKSMRNHANMTHTGIKFHPNLYQGTLLDGVVTNSGKNIEYYVEDVIWYCGINYRAYDRFSRMNNFHQDISLKFCCQPDVTLGVVHPIPMNEETFTDFHYHLTEEKQDFCDKITFYPIDGDNPVHYHKILVDQDYVSNVITVCKFNMKLGIADGTYYLYDTLTEEEKDLAIINDVAIAKLAREKLADLEVVQVTCEYDEVREGWVVKEIF